MRLIYTLGIISLSLPGCRPGPVAAPTGPAPEAAAADPLAVLAELDRLAARALWPGFDPRAIPVAIYDGESTLLFRHPAPPDGFEVAHGREGVWTFSGRYPEVIANSTAMIGGVRTATMMPAAGTPLTSRAALLIHEAFHVFQHEHHPTWSANEVELFTYPVTEPELLALRRLETEALGRAIAAGRADPAECWTREALDLRRSRFAALPDGSASYERQTELAEGLANYVEQRAAGDAGWLPMSAGEFPPEGVRQRAYYTGAALAILLDHFLPGWHATLASDDTLSLDALLARQLMGRAASVGNCGFTAAERESIEQAARADVEELRARRWEARRLFLKEPGWRLVITAIGPPLFPQGFNPLNVQMIAPGEVLHRRFLRLGNQASLEVLGRTALTEPAGVHPLFNGVPTLTLTGLPDDPVVTQAEGVVSVKAEGVTAELSGATLERAGNTTTICVNGAQPPQVQDPEASGNRRR